MSKSIENTLVPISYLTFLVKDMVDGGVNIEQLLCEIGIERRSLNDPDGLIKLSQQTKLLRRATKLFPGISLLLGSRTNIMSHGPIGHAIMCSKDFRQALHTICKYSEIRTPMLNFSLIEQGQLAILKSNHCVELEEEKVLYAETSLSSIKSSLNTLFVRDDQSFHFKFQHSAPIYSEKYTEIFGDRVSFENVDNRVEFPIAYLDKPMALAESSSFQKAINECEHIFAKAEKQKGLKGKVYLFLMSQDWHMPKIGDVSAHFYMTPRTLSRHLKIQGASFQGIVQDVRKKRAYDYLKNSNKSIDEISRILGYEDPSNFRRAFNGWNGQSPRSYRTS